MVTSRQYGVYVAVEISCTLLKQEGKKRLLGACKHYLEGAFLVTIFLLAF